MISVLQIDRLPLAAAGVRIISLDLSLRMMAKIKDKSGGRLPFPLLAADATRLPFADDSFGGATIIHVLHSVPRWEAAIAEVVRVVRPGGVIVLDTGDGRVEMLDEIEARFKQELAERPPPIEVDRRPPRRDISSAWVRRSAVSGCHPAFLAGPAEFLAGLASGIRSWQWSMDEAAFEPAADRVKAWAEEKWGSLDELGRSRRSCRCGSTACRALEDTGRSGSRVSLRRRSAADHAVAGEAKTVRETISTPTAFTASLSLLGRRPASCSSVHATIAAQATTGTSSRVPSASSEPVTVRVRRAAPVKIIPEPPPERRRAAQARSPGDAQ
jgi:SAM-dependent methyltransferase